MKIIRIILLFIIFLGIKGYAAEKYILKEHDPMNLIGDKSIVQNNYNYNGTDLYYSETFINQDKKGPAAAILIIHSGKQRSNSQKLRHLTGTALQSLVRYAKKNNVKVLIIAPQYPLAVNKKVKKIPKKYNDASIQLLKNRTRYYNIPKNRIYITGASIGSSAVNDILNEHQNYFAKAVFVSSGNLYATSFDPKKFKTKIYIIQGEKDLLYEMQQFDKELKEKNIQSTLCVIKNAGHIEAMDITKGYSDQMWQWLFKDERVSYLQLIKLYCKQFIENIKNLFNHKSFT